MVKIFIFSDTNWSLGRVHKSVEKWLKYKYEFTFGDWCNGMNCLTEKINDYDIILTNLIVLNNLLEIYGNNMCLKKFVFVNHGFVEMQKIYPLDTIYTSTSKSITSLFPEIIQPRLFYTYNGVEPSEFNFIQKSGQITKIGWCGGYHVDWKRGEWIHQIANKTNLEYDIQTSLPYDEINKWYNTIDVLLINAGPEEWRETGPLPPFEAVVSGTLVIGTNVGNFKNIPGPKYDTIEEAITILNDLKNNPEKVILLMKEQYDYVMNNWTYEKLIDGWDNAFKASLELSSSSFPSTT
jgi:hypothetical protein